MDRPIIQPPPDPKEFSSYEEYKEAVYVYEHFLGIVEEMEKVFDNAKTDEELNQGLSVLGFRSVEDSHMS
jgi:hypothetical protein